MKCLAARKLPGELQPRELLSGIRGELARPRVFEINDNLPIPAQLRDRFGHEAARQLTAKEDASKPRRAHDAPSRLGRAVHKNSAWSAAFQHCVQARTVGSVRIKESSETSGLMSCR